MNLTERMTEEATTNALDGLANRPDLLDAELPIVVIALKREGVRLPKHWRRCYRAVSEALEVARIIRNQTKAMAHEERLARRGAPPTMNRKRPITIGSTVS